MGTQAVIDVGIPAVVIFLMWLAGLRLAVDDFRRVLERPRLVAAALVVQSLLLPALAVAASSLVGVGPAAALALLLIAACPAGVRPTSTPWSQAATGRSRSP